MVLRAHHTRRRGSALCSVFSDTHTHTHTHTRAHGITLAGEAARELEGLVAGPRTTGRGAMVVRVVARRELLCAALVLLGAQLRPAVAVRYGFTGKPQEYIVPAGVTSIKVVAAGARGGPGSSGGTECPPHTQCTHWHTERTGSDDMTGAPLAAACR